MALRESFMLFGRRLHISPVKIRFDPEQIPRKHFMIFFITIICGEQHTKSLPKSDHHKGSNYDVIKR